MHTRPPQPWPGFGIFRALASINRIFRCDWRFLPIPQWLRLKSSWEAGQSRAGPMLSPSRPGHTIEIPVSCSACGRTLGHRLRQTRPDDAPNGADSNGVSTFGVRLIARIWAITQQIVSMPQPFIGFADGRRDSPQIGGMLWCEGLLSGLRKRPASSADSTENGRVENGPQGCQTACAEHLSFGLAHFG